MKTSIHSTLLGNYISLWTLVSLCALALLAARPPQAQAQDLLIDYISSPDSRVTNARTLVSFSPGTVDVYESSLSEIAESSQTYISTFISGNLQQPTAYVSFLLDPLRLSPAVYHWNAEQARLSALPADALQRDILDLEKSIQSGRIQSLDLQDRIAILESDLISKLSIEQLRERMEEARELERSISEQQHDIVYLESVLSQGRQEQEASDINELRATLSEHLRLAAQVTAAADRLTRRQLEVAKKRINKKLRLITELKRQDPEALAREVLKLRKQRRELENRLGRTSSSSEINEQF